MSTPSPTTLPGLSLVEAEPDEDDPASTDIALPGLGADSDNIPAGPLENAVLDTLKELHKSDLLRPRDAAKVALALDLCRVMAIKRRSGRTSTYSNDARLLSELLDSFTAEEAAGNAALTEAMQVWAASLQAMGLGVQPLPPS